MTTMRQLTALDARFLDVESPTTVGHVGSLVVLDPSTAPEGKWNLDTVRSFLEPRLHLAPPLRRRAVAAPLGMGLPAWVEDPHFDLEFHLREVALPGPGTRRQLGEQVARIHARPLDRARPLWEGYVITGLEDGRAAYYSKIHHAAIDGVSGAGVLETLLDQTPEPREVLAEEASVPRRLPSGLDLLRHGLTSAVTNPGELAWTVPRALRRLDELPGVANLPGVGLLSSAAGAVSRVVGGGDAGPRGGSRSLPLPRTPLNGPITPHRRFAYGSLSMADVQQVEDHFATTVDDVVMTVTAAALREWLLDHDGLPATPLVVAVPVFVTGVTGDAAPGGRMSVMTAELPTHLADPAARLEFVRESMVGARRHLDAVPATALPELAHSAATGPWGLAARALFEHAAVPGVPSNVCVSSVPVSSVPSYVAGARVEGIHPVSAVTDATGALNVTACTYDGDLDFGLTACREVVPDVWNIVGYLEEAMADLVVRTAPHPS
jgi:diacylglycerol O-acyltransferase